VRTQGSRHERAWDETIAASPELRALMKQGWEELAAGTSERGPTVRYSNVGLDSLAEETAVALKDAEGVLPLVGRVLG
jgi:hypothetical protein